VESDPRIKTHLDTELTGLEGFVGNFRATLRTGDREKVVEHGVAIIATGAQEHVPHEYLYGEDPRVLTHLDLDQKFTHDPSSLRGVKTAVFIQCVGSREPERPYCSRVCCTHSIQSALHLKELNPEMDVFILYRDIRTYGERELLYRRARAEGVLFVRFSLENKPRVTAAEEGLEIQVFDPVLQRPLLIKADLLTLATAIVPHRDERLARLFKVPMNEDGFFVEAHAKLAPCDFASAGIFLCGMAHYPKPIDESVAQAQAAASRALTVLSRQTIQLGGVVSRIRDDLCSGCMGCIRVCPYRAIAFNEGKRIAEVNEALCKGCGACAAACPSEAIVLYGFDNRQLYAQIRSALSRA
jgi:heterodisulfide reductase subunit A